MISLHSDIPKTAVTLNFLPPQEHLTDVQNKLDKTCDQLNATEQDLKAITSKHNSVVLRNNKEIEEIREKNAELEEVNSLTFDFFDEGLMFVKSAMSQLSTKS